MIRPGILEEVHIQYITFQLLQALKQLQSRSLVHCYIVVLCCWSLLQLLEPTHLFLLHVQPRYIRVNSNCTIELSGMANKVTHIGNTFDGSSSYSSRWYLPPERLNASPAYVMLSCECLLLCTLNHLFSRFLRMRESSAIWQVGLVLAEMMERRTLFAGSYSWRAQVFPYGRTTLRYAVTRFAILTTPDCYTGSA